MKRFALWVEFRITPGTAFLERRETPHFKARLAATEALAAARSVTQLEAGEGAALAPSS